MECPACSHPNRADARFCGQCGQALNEAFDCPECGAENPAGQRFCDHCGAAAPAADGAAAGDSRISGAAGAPRAPPPDTSREDPRRQGALEGERKQVTVLFADVMGSMELAERSDPEEWRRIMDALLRDPLRGRPPLRGHRRQVHRRRDHGALRRADRPRGPRAPRLLRGAAPPARARRLRRRAAPCARAQLLGADGAQLRRGRRRARSARTSAMDYTAIGHTVGLAQRMEQLAEPGNGLPDRAHRGAGRGLLRARGPRRVRGQGRQPSRCGSTS